MKIRVFVAMGMQKNEEDIDIPDGWDEMSEEEKEEALNFYAETHMVNHVDCGAYVVEEGE